MAAVYNVCVYMYMCYYAVCQGINPPKSKFIEHNFLLDMRSETNE